MAREAASAAGAAIEAANAAAAAADVAWEQASPGSPGRDGRGGRGGRAGRGGRDGRAGGLSRTHGRSHQAQVDATLRAVFERFDANRSGRLDYSELRNCLHALGVDATRREAAEVLALVRVRVRVS